MSSDGIKVRRVQLFLAVVAFWIATDRGWRLYSNVPLRVLDQAKVTGSEELQGDRPKAQRFAYAFYVSNDAYGCGALVNMARLIEVGGGLPPAIDLIMIAKDGAVSDRILSIAEKEMHAKIYFASGFGPDVDMGTPVGVHTHYRDCFLKFLAFLLPADTYRRLILIDTDSLVLRPPNHLFHLPDELPIAAPKAYWLGPDQHIVTDWLLSVSHEVGAFLC